MKFGKLEIPPKKKFSEEEKRNIINDTKIDPKSIIDQAIDNEGNIINCSDLFNSLLYKKLGEKMGEDNFSELYDKDRSLYSESPSPFFWKNRELQDNFAYLINKNFFKKDIEKVIAMQFIKDVNGVLFSDSEGDTYDPNLFKKIKDNLFEKAKNKDSTIIEKTLLREIIFDIIENENTYTAKEEVEKKISFTEKEIGKISGLENFYDEKLSQYNFDFNEEQKDLLMDDSKNVHGRNSFKYGYDLSHVKIHHIEPDYIDPWDLKDFYISGDYINSWISPNILGIYGRSGKLVGWQEDNNLNANGVNKIKDFSEIKNKLVISSIEDLALFKVSSSLHFRDYVQNILNINLSKFSIENQFYFLNFIQGKTEEDLGTFKEFIKKSINECDKENRFRAFLSIQHGGQKMGDKILSLGEKLPEEIAQKVFAKYGEIIDVADKAEEEVKKLYEKENIPNNVFISIKETLLKKGAELLSGLSDGLNKNKNIDGEEIIKKLEDIKTSTIIMGQSYIELYKQGINIPIEDIKNTTLEKISAQNLTSKEKGELLKVYENGRPKETYENKKHIKLLKDEFEETLNNKDTFVFNIRFNGEVVAFATFNKVNEDTLHIGGLTFIDDIRNPAIGAAVMNSIMNEFGDFNIEALVHSENKILAMYQKRFGFKIKKELPREENAGELYYEIERPKNIKIEERESLERAA